MQIKFRPLNKAAKIVELLGYSISYSYDDLIFLDNTALLLQFDDTVENGLIYHFNKDATTEFITDFENKIQSICNKNGMTVIKGRKFQIIKKIDKEEIDR